MRVRRLKQCIGLVRVVTAAGVANPAIDDEVRDVDPLWRQFAREALGESAQCKLAHRKRGRLRVSLDARRSAGEQNRAMSPREHPDDGLLRDPKRPRTW